MEFDDILYGLPQEPDGEKPVPEPPAEEPQIPAPPVPEPPAEEPQIPAPPVPEPPAEEPPIPVPPAEEPPIPAPPAEEPPIPEPPLVQPPEIPGFAFTAQPVDETAPPVPEEPAEPAQTEPTQSVYTAPAQTNDYVSGTYRFGPGAFAQQSRDSEPIYGTHRGDYGYRTVRATVQPAYAPQTPAPAPAPARKPKKKHTGLWIALALVFTLAAGGVLGFFGHKLFAGPAEAQPAPVSPTQPAKTEKPAQPAQPREGDLGGRIIRGDSTEYTAPAEIYSQNVDAVVGISNESTTTNIWGQASSTASSGTGFIISEDGYILTNYHVAKGADKLTVTLSSGVRYPAELVGYENVTCDVALLKIEAEGLPTVKLGDSDALQVGEQVCTIGNPLGELTYTLTVGYISSKERAINTDGNPINMLQTDAAINSGNSGGPLFDMAGNVVGIVTAKYSGSTTTGASIEGIGFAIPISNVVSILDDLQQYGYVTDRAYLGVMVADASEVRGANLPAGAYLSSVTPGACADRAGLQAGDVIVGMGEQVINSYEALVTALNRFRAGETAEITYFRDGAYLKTEATFDARPRETEAEDEQSSQPTEPSYSYGFDDPFGFFFP